MKDSRERFEPTPEMLLAARYELDNDNADVSDREIACMYKAMRSTAAPDHQPAVAGAVDEAPADMQAKFYLWQKDITALHKMFPGPLDAFKGGYSWALDDLRTASPSQPAAEGDDQFTLSVALQVVTILEKKMRGDPTNQDAQSLGYLIMSQHQRIVSALRASPADDGEMIRLIKYVCNRQRWVCRDDAASGYFAAFRQQDKQS